MRARWDGLHPELCVFIVSDPSALIIIKVMHFNFFSPTICRAFLEYEG